jgi:hypothetical protein
MRRIQDSGFGVEVRGLGLGVWEHNLSELSSGRTSEEVQARADADFKDFVRPFFSGSSRPVLEIEKMGLSSPCVCVCVCACVRACILSK